MIYRTKDVFDVLYDAMITLKTITGKMPDRILLSPQVKGFLSDNSVNITSAVAERPANKPDNWAGTFNNVDCFLTHKDGIQVAFIMEDNNG